MKYLILGSNSFSGSSFIKKLLQKKNKVIAVSRSAELSKTFQPYFKYKNKENFKFYKIDINKDLKKLFKIIEKEKPKIVVNFAAQSMVDQSWENPNHWYQTNILSSVNIVNKLQNYSFFKKFINFSTPEVYGNNNRWIKENINFNPTTPYAISRSAFDQYLLLLNKFKKFPVIFTRASNVYGPSQKLYRIIPKLIMQIKKKQIFNLHGNGKSKRSFIHIDDVSDALLILSKKGKIGETYHISTDRIITIKNISKIICKEMKVEFKKFVKSSKERRGKDHAYMLDAKKISRKLGWKPKVDIYEGIKEVKKWIENNFNELDQIPLRYIHKK